MTTFGPFGNVLLCIENWIQILLLRPIMGKSIWHCENGSSPIRTFLNFQHHDNHPAETFFRILKLAYSFRQVQLLGIQRSIIGNMAAGNLSIFFQLLVYTFRCFPSWSLWTNATQLLDEITIDMTCFATSYYFALPTKDINGKVNGETAQSLQNPWQRDQEEEMPPRGERFWIWCWEYASWFSVDSFRLAQLCLGPGLLAVPSVSSKV